MTGFLADLVQFPFLRMALAAALLASIGCGIIGAHVTVRRTTYIAGAIAHCTLGGMGAARWLQQTAGLAWCTPLAGAVTAALAAALIIARLQARSNLHLDTILSAVWSMGMAIGILFISQTPGYNEDLMSYLFGDILMVRPADLWLLAGLDVVLVAGLVLFQRHLTAIAFDEEFARLTGAPVDLINTVFLCLVALTTVLLVQLVGIILVVALLALPAAAASRITRTLTTMTLTAMGYCLAATGGGLILSYGADLPAGAMIILLAGGLYLATDMTARLVRRRDREKSRDRVGS